MSSEHGDVPKPRAMLAHEEPKHDLARDERKEHPRFRGGRVGEANEPYRRFQQTRIEGAASRARALPELISCHQAAFEFFGGIPATILYDNMAQVRQPHNKELHPLMADFAAHYGFAVRTHRPYRPRTKGKVERAVRLLDDGFLRGRAFADLQDLIGQAQTWLATANTRVHATTGEKPAETHLREKLTPFQSFVPYVLAIRHERRVDAEGFVRVKGARYSTPPEMVGKRVIVAVGEQSVTIRLGEAIVAEHRPVRPGESSAQREHVASFWKLARATPTPVPKMDLTRERIPQVEICPLSRYEVFEAIAPRDIAQGTAQ